MSKVSKAFRVAANLISHPSFIGPYFSTLSKEPISVGLPWISFAAINALEEFLNPSMSVFEYGSGGSTLFFARRCRSVFSIEDQNKWFEHVSAALCAANLSNAKIRHCHADPIAYSKQGLPIEDTTFADSPYVMSLRECEHPDVILIDGADDWGLIAKRRSICFQLADKVIAEGGIIIVDDSWAYPELRKSNNARWVKTFSSVGPCMRAVHSTDIFFY